MPKKSPRILLIARGAVLLEPSIGAFGEARLTVTLEDIGVIDAPSRPLASQTTEQLSYDGHATLRIPFEFPGVAPDMAKNLSVRAHLAFHPGTSIEPGDWVTTRTYPIRSQSLRGAIEILLRRV